MREINNVDFGAPIDEKDERNEVIAVKLGGGIKNVAEMMFYSMRFNNYDKWKKKYPGLEALDQLSSEERFIRCTYYTEENFLRAMRAPLEPLRVDEIAIDTGVVRGELFDIWLCHLTAMEIGLHNILKHSFCKKLYIFDAVFTENTKEYLYKEYQRFKSSIALASGTLIDIVESLPEITTIIMDDIEEIVKMVEYEEVKNPELLKGKAFWIASNCSIDTNAKKDDNINLAHKYDDFMSLASKNDGFQINWFNHSIVTFEKPGNVILPE